MPTITPAKDLEVCLSQKDNLEAIFNSVSDGIITTNNELVILNLNKAAAEYIRTSRDNAIGKKYSSVFKNYLGDIGHILYKIIRTKKPITDFKSNYFDKEGAQKKIVVNTAILKDKDNCNKGIVIVFKDVTELSLLRRQLKTQHRFENIIGKNREMQEVYQLIESVADSDASTLIYGESGTGKELAALAIHNKSSRAEEPFIKVNCSALSEPLLESELFGHVKGAFTGAIYDKKGRFQLAHRGTIFLDEIGDISPVIQIKLLRVLQERTIERVGDANPVPVDVRIISATNKNLKKLIAANIFREDLYYRLKVISITLPPLRERTDDIVLLIDHFIEKYNIQTGKNIKSVDSKALDLFMQYPWKGNVMELENAIEHSFVLCRGDIINSSHIPIEIRDRKEDVLIKNSKSQQETIEDALRKSGWNKAKAARLLGIDRTTLWRKIREMKIVEGKDG